MISAIDLLPDKVEHCTVCPNLSPWKRFPNDVHGNLRCQAMIVSESHGGRSVKKGNFWHGASGDRIRKALSECNKHLEDGFYLTDIAKGHPANDRKSKASEISNFKRSLEREIQSLKPKCILVFGETALRYFMDHFTPKRDFGFSSLL